MVPGATSSSQQNSCRKFHKYDEKQFIDTKEQAAKCIKYDNLTLKHEALDHHDLRGFRGLNDYPLSNQVILTVSIRMER